jgi:hypothetical protein
MELRCSILLNDKNVKAHIAAKITTRAVMSKINRLRIFMVGLLKAQN